MREDVKQQLVERNTAAVYGEVQQNQSGYASREPGKPHLVGMTLPAGISLDLVAGAVKFAVDLAVVHFGPALDVIAESQKALVDKFISDTALEAIAAAVRRLETTAKPAV